MKKIIVMMLMVGTLGSFTPKEPDTTSSVKELTGYRLKNKVTVLNDFNLWVVTNDITFDKIFVAETETVARPDFDSEIVLAAKAETLANSYQIRFKRTEIRKTDLNVYFGVQKSGPAQDGAGPVSLMTVQRNSNIRRVNFYHDNILVRSIPIVTVY
jgi:hypothetical protein